MRVVIEDDPTGPDPEPAHRQMNYKRIYTLLRSGRSTILRFAPRSLGKLRKTARSRAIHFESVIAKLEPCNRIVLDFFKREAAGYQRRLNAVRRSSMPQKSKSKKRA